MKKTRTLNDGLELSGRSKKECAKCTKIVPQTQPKPQK
jgi:hypothetical protein